MLTHHLMHPEGEAVAEGSVIIIGGAEDGSAIQVILNRFASLAGGRDDRGGDLDRIVARRRSR